MEEKALLDVDVDAMADAGAEMEVEGPASDCLGL